MKLNKKAFTLAEVLVTLVIVGAVASITVPKLVNNFRAAVLSAQFKKAYTSFDNATRLIVANEFGGNGEEVSKSNVSVDTMLDYYQKYMAKAVKCSRSQACPKGVFPKVANSSYRLWIEEHYKNYTGDAADGSCVSDSAIVLKDGTFAIIDDVVYITVDINGWNKGPNRFGHDFFMFEIVNGVLKPMGSDGTKYKLCSTNSDSGNNGRGCTIEAVRNPNYFKNLPR